MVNAERVGSDLPGGSFRERLPCWTYALAPRPFDWVQTFLYLAVVVNFFVVSPTDDVSWERSGGLVGAIITLLVLDRWEHLRYHGPPPARAAIALLIIRVALIEVVALIDGFNISPFLYVVLPFTTVVAFGTLAGWGVGALICLRYLLQLIDYGDGWFMLQWNSDLLVLFIMGIIFVLSMSELVVRAQTSQARTEKLLAELEASHRQLTAYAAQVADLATVSERNRLARDIHDSLGHYLTVINVQLEKALAFRAKDAQIADRSVEDSKRLAREALDDVRRSVGMLRANPQSFSLHDALQTLVERTRNEQLQITLSVEGDETAVAPQALMALYRVAQEGLTNVQRHAGAGHVTIAANVDALEARLSIVDDGIGFDLADAQGEKGGRLGGYGLRGVRERLELVAGSLQVETRPGQGTQLTAAIPHTPNAWPALVPQGSQR